jgi:glycosyltransferase involved in cell wall biosynthesis
VKRGRDILLVNWNDRTNPFAGGAEIHLHELFSRLVERGHRVTLLCSGYRGASPREVLDGIDVRRIGGRYTYNFVLPRHLRRLVRDEPFDIVVEALNKIPLYSPLYSPLPVVAIGHHLFGTTIFREVPPPMSLYVYLSELPLARGYRGVPVEVISRSTGDDFAARGLPQERIRVVYVGIDREQYRPGPGRAGQPTLLALGRIRKYKRLDLVVDAVAELARGRHPELRLIVAGSGNWERALREHVRATGASSCVEFVGRVTEEEKVALYRRAWAMVMTSPKEGWGLTCLEAQACGTPVIASDSPGLREAVRDGETGILVPHGDRVRLVDAIDGLLRDGARREELSRGAVRFADTFSWERCADETMELIEAELAKREAS